MRRTLLACLSIAFLVASALADTPTSKPNILAPTAPALSASSADPAAPIAKSQVPKVASKRELTGVSSRSLLKVRGTIVDLRANDAKKGRIERVILSIGKKVIAINVDAATILRTRNGKLAPLSALKKGEKVAVSYKTIGRRERAVSMTILS